MPVVTTTGGRARDEYISIRSAEFRAVIGATLFIMLGYGLIVPALPQFAKRFGAGDAGVSLILVGFALTRLVGDFFVSSLIDRFGERGVTMAGAGIVGVSSLAAGASQSFWQLVLLRGVGGFGSALFLGGLTAYLVGTVLPEERGRAMSVFQGSVGIGFLLGPVFGGLVIAAASVNTPFYIYGAVCLAFVPLCARAMRHAPEAGRAEEVVGRPSWRAMKPLLQNSAYRAALGASAVAFIVTAAPQTILPRYWTDTLHLSKASSGIPFFVEAAAGMLVIWHAGALSDRRGRKFVLAPALAAGVVACIGLGAFGGEVALIGWMALLGFANGYSRPGPTAIVADVASPDERAVAVAGYRIAGDLGALIGPALAGLLAKYVGYGAAWIGTAACVAVVFFMAVGSVETMPVREPA
jgi:MFS family permease